MKNFNLLFIVALALLAAACQRSVPAPGVPNTGSDTTGTQLDKTVTITHHQLSFDSITTQYTYNSNNKLIDETELQFTFDSSANTIYQVAYFNRFSRDGLGRVTALYWGGWDISPASPEDTSQITHYFYENSTSPLIAYEISNNYNNEYDSNAYHHNSQGLVTSIENYHIGNSGVATKTGSQGFTYGANNNITEIKVYGYSDENGGHADGLAFTYTYQYDNNPNPFFTGDDLMRQWLWADPYKMYNNPTLFNQASNALNPANPLVTINQQTYTYRTDGKPLTRDIVASVNQGNGPHSQSKTTYFYK